MACIEARGLRKAFGNTLALDNLEALHGERRDRSILFWKSLPVSDFTTVLAKASVPLVVLPALTFAIIVATQIGPSLPASPAATTASADFSLRLFVGVALSGMRRDLPR